MVLNEKEDRLGRRVGLPGRLPTSVPPLPPDVEVVPSPPPETGVKPVMFTPPSKRAGSGSAASLRHTMRTWPGTPESRSLELQATWRHGMPAPAQQQLDVAPCERGRCAIVVTTGLRIRIVAAALHFLAHELPRVEQTGGAGATRKTAAEAAS
jgi:hypothetical protein